MNDFESNLPIPNREKNHGNALPEVYSCHHQSSYAAGQHPWRGKPDQNQYLEDNEGTVYRHDDGSLPPRPDSTAETKRKLFGLDLPIAILTISLVFVTACLVVVAGLLGHKVIQLERTLPSVISPQVDTNDSDSEQQQQPIQSITANLTETIQVSIPGWSYYGCYYDNSTRVLADYALYDKDNLTNQICADKCTDRIYQYFGTTNGRRCFCDSTADKLKRAPDWGCNSQCPGQKNVFEACGGPSFHLSVWRRN
ncbi:hypothetical protein QBC36DRAFT_299733 [Triangularia setosa]|uniref:WSC domain-containing protein n=1 Tax=Triangularia setosa TaxID=2587417 RepID=A0AAN6WA24_9PEZI|nr:hypothetical protein QBC36DRAFT_299733 [Podospora setosa]